MLLTLTLLLISSAIPGSSALPLAETPAAVTATTITSCQTPTQASLAFRTLDFPTLQTLQSQNLKATFFIDPLWIRANPYVVQQAVDQGHSLGLAIPDAKSLVVSRVCNCAYSVDQTAFDAFFANAVKLWNEETGWLKTALRVVSLTSEPYINQIGSQNRVNRYGELQKAIVAKQGLSPVVVSYGADVSVFENAGLHRVVLSNVLDSSAFVLNATAPVGSAGDVFLNGRVNVTSLEDVVVVKAAAEFLGSIGKEVVSAGQCFGFAAN
ncbi:hypothetical protein BDR26DRAFT_940279 [Obelidium mucronatum]|nr:hypothetical protein BDR26DRAFT_940279 [Obelidium mucronatum]